MTYTKIFKSDHMVHNFYDRLLESVSRGGEYRRTQNLLILMTISYF